MVDGNCKSCLYFTDFKMMGQCKRYPMYQNRHSTEWCGEYKAAPVLEPVQLTAVVVGISSAESKKRGRPAKDVQ
jgi:hypothetical protein